MKKNKIIFLVIALCLVIAGIVIFLFINNKNYEVEDIKNRNYYPLYENGKVGVINTKGEVIINPIYDDIQLPNPLKPVFICLSNYNKQLNTYHSVIKNDKNENIFTEYSEVRSIAVNGIVGELPYEKSALKYRKDNKYGLINFEGKEITRRNL